MGVVSCCGDVVWTHSHGMGRYVYDLVVNVMMSNEVSSN